MSKFIKIYKMPKFKLQKQNMNKPTASKYI